MKSICFLITVFFAISSFAQSEISLQEEEKTNKNIKVKKTKDGTNVYNFNFYNAQKKSKRNSKNSAATTKISKLKVKEKSTRGGSGPQIEYFYTVFSGDSEALGHNNGPVVKNEHGLKFSYRLTHKKTGLYVSPGYINSTSDSGWADEGDSEGFFIRLGKMNNNYKTFFLDYGVELSKTDGESMLDRGTDGYERQVYEFKNISLYMSPSLRGKNISVAWPILVGRSSASTSIESSYYDNFSGDYSERFFSYDDKSMFLSLAMNVSYYF